MKIETHVADRKQLVNQIAQALGLEAKYLGAPGFAYQVGPYVINRQAEIEVDDTEADMDLLRELIPSGALDDAPETEIEALEISVPTEGHTVTSIMNLLHLFCSREKLLNRCVGNARNFLMNKKFIKALDDQVPESLEAYFDRQMEVGGEKVNRGLTIIQEKVTVAFPYTEDADTIKAYTDLVSLMNQMALMQKRVLKDKFHSNNEKYAFRCWLVRLGMVGDDYKMTRKTLLSNMPGNSAFRTEDQKEAALEKLKAKKGEEKKCSEYQAL